MFENEVISKYRQYKSNKEKYSQYRIDWESISKNYIESSVPIHIDLEITTKCNLRCSFCPRTQMNLKSEDMPLEMVKKIIDEFSLKGGCAIKFVYLGEPLLYPHLGEIIKYAKDSGIIDTIISTNGNLLNEKNIIELIQSGLDKIIFSVDSIHPRTYKEIRVNGNLSKVLRGLILFQYLRDKLKSKTPETQIQVISMQQNKMEIIFKYYREFYKDFVDKIRISPFCLDYQNKKEIGEKPNFHCPSPFRRMTIRVNGDICVCCGSRTDSKILGNIRVNTLEEIWNSQKFREIRSLMKNGKSHLIECCNFCDHRRH